MGSIDPNSTQVHDQIFLSIAEANWDTQYLNAQGKVCNKTIFGRIAHFFGIQWNSAIADTLYMIRGRLELYEKKPDIGLYTSQLVKMVEKINLLIDRINTKRPHNGLSALSQEFKIREMGTEARFLGIGKGGQVQRSKGADQSNAKLGASVSQVIQ
jgi:hypothetical protein